MLPVILASPAFPSLSILSHTYPYLSGSFLSPLVVPRFVRNPKVFLTSPYFARLTLLSRIFPDHSSLLRVGPGFSRMPRLFQFPQVVQSNQLYLHCYQTILPASDCSGLSPMSMVVSMNPKLFRVLLGCSILFLIVTDRSAPVPMARVRTKNPLVSFASRDLPKGGPPPPDFLDTLL